MQQFKYIAIMLVYQENNLISVSLEGINADSAIKVDKILMEFSDKMSKKFKDNKLNVKCYPVNAGEIRELSSEFLDLVISGLELKNKAIIEE